MQIMGILVQILNLGIKRKRHNNNNNNNSNQYQNTYTKRKPKLDFPILKYINCIIRGIIVAVVVFIINTSCFCFITFGLICGKVRLE
jgi:hypothetical protein